MRIFSSNQNENEKYAQGQFQIVLPKELDIW